MTFERLAQLRKHLRCECAEGPHQLRLRRTCFGSILSLLGDWPSDPSRQAAFDEAAAALTRWNPTFRHCVLSWGNRLIHTEKGQVKDTLAFVRELDVFEPDDGHPRLLRRSCAAPTATRCSA